MSTEIPRPANDGPTEPIRIEIPPPEVGIKQVDITGLGILTVRLAPVGASAQGYGGDTYQLSTRGATGIQITAWYTDGSIRAANASRAQLDSLVDKVNQGQEYDVIFELEEVVAPTSDNIVPELDSVRLSGELTVDYAGESQTGGIGGVSIGYLVDVGRLQELRGDSTAVQARTTAAPAPAGEHEAGA